MADSRRQRHDKILATLRLGAVLGGATYGMYWFLKSSTTCENSDDRASLAKSQSQQKRQHPSRSEICPICRDPMTTKCKTFLCQHTFHKKCIAEWQTISRTCPVCRSTMRSR